MVANVPATALIEFNGCVTALADPSAHGAFGVQEPAFRSVCRYDIKLTHQFFSWERHTYLTARFMFRPQMSAGC
jgi:hypothetical protein